MGDAFDLCRFVRAQAGIYPTALSELREGEKRTHWMWFVFPQVEGLGNSRNARFFGISGRSEASAFVAHDLLGPRLLECTHAMLGWAGRKSAVRVLGPIDALKLQSSMTLFEAVAPDPEPFVRVLAEFYAGRRDGATLERLKTEQAA